MKNTISKILLAWVLMIAFSCRDQLSEKSDLKLATPATIADNQALLDQFGIVNLNYASSGETSADDYYMTEEDFDGLYFEQERNMYTWQPAYIFKTVSIGNDWLYCYKAIYVSNAVLHNLTEYNLVGPDADAVKGQALALRASHFLDAVQLWSPAYNKSTAGNDLGIPLRLDPDFNLPTVRASVQQTYDQILSDLHSALPLLPEKQPYKSRISRAAVYGYLARTYLFMGEYQKALDNAQLALATDNTLMDYNFLDASAEYPVPEFNEEVSFWAGMMYEYHLISAKIPVALYNLYGENDLRKEVFFTKDEEGGHILFKGHYNNINGPNTSVCTDELYLIAAEAYAHLGQVAPAMQKLNELLITRWKSGTFTALTAATKSEALAVIREERRKELLLRGLRWSDLKRYNRDGAGITLERTVHGRQYRLLPNDLRYALPIPEEIVERTGIPQNPR